MPQAAEDHVQRRTNRRRHVGATRFRSKAGWSSTCARPDPASLAAVDANIQKAIDAAVAEENARWGKPRRDHRREGTGRRSARGIDAGELRRSSGAASRAATVLGFTSNLGEGSTDSNTPMSAGAFRRSRSAAADAARDAHALTESFDTTDAWMGTQHALLLDDRARSEVMPVMADGLRLMAYGRSQRAMSRRSVSHEPSHASAISHDRRFLVGVRRARRAVADVVWRRHAPSRSRAHRRRRTFS